MKRRDFLRIVIDLDGTIVEEKGERERSKAVPLPRAVESVNALYEMGHTIIIYSGRSYRELELTLNQLKQCGVKYHHLVLGKPVADILIDDRAVSFTGWAGIWNDLLKTVKQKMREPTWEKGNACEK